MLTFSRLISLAHTFLPKPPGPRDLALRGGAVAADFALSIAGCACMMS
jgi:hypothetical protein